MQSDIEYAGAVSASELAQVNLSEVSDPREATRLAKLATTYNEMNSGVRNNTLFEV